MNNSKHLVFGFCILISFQLHAQIPNLGVEIKLNLNSIKNTINDEKGSADFILNLPMPDGAFQVFNLKTSNIMENQPSNIQTIEGVSLDGLAKIRLAITPSALTGIMQYENGYYLIEAIDQKEGRYTIYNMNDSGLGNCGTADLDESKLVKRNGKVLSTGLFPIGTQLRKYRFAGAATGEMTDSLGTQTAARDKIVAILNATNLIFNLEASVSFELVSKTTDLTLIFTDGATDPFPVNTSFGNAGDAQTGFNSMNANGTILYSEYDMGHTFNIYKANGGSRGSGGGSPCDNTSKSVGWTEFGISTALGNTVGLFAHEVGHQFGMGHTYNATGGSDSSPTFCTGGWNSQAAVEPGSGTTLMGYGGNCSNNTSGSLSSYVLTNPRNETYFHAKSLDQMFTKMTGISNCFTSVSTGNNAPIVSVGSAATIPKGTPFILTGSATDADAGNLLSYNWSQIDVAAANDEGALGSINGIGGYNAVNSTTAPLFRSRISTSPSRTFPDLSFILNNANNPADNEGEDLPQVARIMNFRLTVRDNATGGGGVDSDLRVITVDNSGPFRISSQNGPTLWFQGEHKIITWDVNGTNTGPVNCTKVNILISTDGGATFSSLVANTTNDGTETITVPHTVSSNVRIKVEAVGNIFFDINNGSITISNGTCTPETSQLADASAVSAAVGSSNLNLNLLAVGSSIPGFSGSIETTDPTSNLSFEKTGVCSGPSNSNRFDDYSFSVTTAGTFTFNLSGTGGNLLNLYSAAYNSSNVCTNWLASTGVYDNANNWVSLNSSMSKDLSPGTYYLVASSFSSTLPTLPAGYGVTVSGGTIYSQVPSSGSPYDYTFMIYNTGTSMVVGFSTTADLSLYNAGTYAVYGISYGGGLDLSPYIGQSLAAVQAAISNSTLCAVLSSNNKVVNITACSPIPSPPSVANVTINSGNAGVLTSGGCAGTVKWYDSASSGTLLFTGVNFTSPILTATTSYFATCTGTCVSTPRTEGIITVAQIAYCTAPVLNCNDGDVITNIKILENLTEIINQSSACGANGYALYNHSSENLVVNNTYSISVTKNTQYSDGLAVWIDFNKNFVFENNERIMQKGSNIVATQTANFTVPASAVLGQTRMRVKIDYLGNTGDPCISEDSEHGVYGEIEDYIINISSAVNPCPESITHTSTVNDFNANTQTFVTSKTTGAGLISATNHIAGGNTTYDAGKRIELNPGFSAISTPGNPAVFLAKIGGCN